jgi:lysophospholipase L1-like esterase
MGLRIAWLVLLGAALAVTSVACGGDDGDGPSPGATTSPADTTARPTARSTRTPSATPPSGPAPGEDPQGDQLLYLALGDSLSEGIGATDERRTAWVPLVATALGDGYELLNLGVAGHDSEELIEEGPLDAAVAEITGRANDGDPSNDVAAITLEIGGNDLLDLYFDLVLPGVCPSIPEALQRPVCVDALRAALDNYGPNLDTAIERLQAAAPGVPVFLMTLYNPFSGNGGIIDEIGVLALEGMEGTPFPTALNDIIRERAAAHEGVVLVEWYELFFGKQRELISNDLIHPNDQGYALMADAVLAAMRAQGLP